MDFQLELELHPEKSKIVSLSRGISLLGFRVFYYHKLMLKKIIRQFTFKYSSLCRQYQAGEADYDQIYNFIEGWIAYVQYANSYALRKKILTKFEEDFCHEISIKEISRQERLAS